MAADDEANGAPADATRGSLLARTSCPVWLNPERFLEPEFNADACVADLRRYVPLATLQNELSSYLATLKAKLVEVINEDYSGYVGLSGRLANVEGAVVRMRKPLLELRDKLHAVQEAVRSELTALNQGLRKRKEVATQRSLLELVLEVSHVAAKVEKLLEEVAAADRSAAPAPQSGADGHAAPGPAAGAELVAQCRLLERVAAEVSRLAFLANKGKDLAFVRSLEPRIAAHRAALRGRLSAALSSALAARNTPAALHALHAAADLGEAGPAEAAVRSVVVAPLVERLIGEHKAAGHPASLSSGSAGGGLGALLGALSAAVRSELGPLLDATLAPGSALRSLDLLSNALLDEAQGALAAALPGVFSPGVPPAFHANYLATAAWLRGLEAMCATRGAVERLRASPAFAALQRRWNTSVYFSLLYQEIAGEFEDVLGADRLKPAPPAPPAAAGDALAAAAAPLQLAASAALLRCLRRTASPDTVLPPLTDRFLRLALQLATRYAAWLSAASAARRDALAGAAAAAAAAAPPASPLPLAGAGSVPPPTPPGPASAPGAAAGGASGSPGAAASSAPPAVGPAAWAPSLPAEELAAILHDAELAHDAIRGPVTAAFLDLLPPQPPPSANGTGKADGPAPAADASAVAAAVRGSLAEAAEAVRCGGRCVAGVLTDEVVERCVAVVRQLKGITATYRMTAKGPPTRASHYVGGVLTPLRALLDAPHAKRLAPALQQELLVVPVAEGVCARYAGLADELLLSVRKTESSLKRLKKAKGGAGEEEHASSVSDSDKITLQLHLDVEELGAQLRRMLGGEEPGARLPAFKRLQEVVAPPPGLLGLVAGGAGASV